MKVATIKILRQALGLSLAEAGKVLKRFPEPIISGIKIEMEWLKELLASDGVQAAVVMQNRDIQPWQSETSSVPSTE